MNMWQSIEETLALNPNEIKDGREILVFDEIGSPPYVTRWYDDVYTVQCGHGGPCGWFSGNYRDNWGDYPIMDQPKYWMELPDTNL